MDAVKAIFDGYDAGVRYADDALGAMLNKLDDLGVLDETAVLVSSDHAAQLERTGLDDPMDAVRSEGGPFHVRGHLRAYLERLRATGRENWAQVLAERHPHEL